MNSGSSSWQRGPTSPFPVLQGPLRHLTLSGSEAHFRLDLSELQSLEMLCLKLVDDDLPSPTSLGLQQLGSLHVLGSELCEGVHLSSLEPLLALDVEHICLDWQTGWSPSDIWTLHHYLLNQVPNDLVAALHLCRHIHKFDACEWDGTAEVKHAGRMCSLEDWCQERC